MKEKREKERTALVCREKIIGMHINGRSVSEIGASLGVHRTTVSRWIKRYEEFSLKVL